MGLATTTDRLERSSIRKASEQAIEAKIIRSTRAAGTKSWTNPDQTAAALAITGPVRVPTLFNSRTDAVGEKIALRTRARRFSASPREMTCGRM